MGNGNMCISLKDIIPDLPDPLDLENSNGISSSTKNISLNYSIQNNSKIPHYSNYTIINSRICNKSNLKNIISTFNPNYSYNNKSENNNQMKISLGDKYIGETYDSIPYGRGKYFSSNGEIREGYFIK